MVNPSSMERARQHFADGNRAAASEALRSRLEANPSDEEARRQLVEFHRQWGNPDQAGRWAAPIGGLPSERELDRLARFLASSQAGPSDLVRLTLAPKGHEFPHDVVSLFDGTVGYYTGLQAARHDTRVVSTAEDRAATVTIWAVLIYLFAVVVGLVSVYSTALLGTGNAPTVARTVNVVLGSLLGTVILAFGVKAATSREPLKSTILIILGIALVVGFPFAAAAARARFDWI